MAMCTVPDAQLMEAFPHANTRNTSAQHYHMEVIGRQGWRWRCDAVKEGDYAEAGQEKRGGCPALEEKVGGL